MDSSHEMNANVNSQFIGVQTDFEDLQSIAISGSYLI